MSNGERFLDREPSRRDERWLFIASPIIVLLLWEAAVATHLIDGRFFPPPHKIFAKIWELAVHEDLHEDVLASMRRIVVGTAMGFFPGVLLGIGMGLSRWTRAFFAPLVALSYPIPKIAILPLLLIIFGIGEMTNLMVVAIGVFFLSLINTFDGVRRIPKQYFEVARVYGVSKRDVFFRIVLPATAPSIFTGLKLGAGYGLILIVAAEMIAARHGLGHRIWNSWETYIITELYACLFLISLIGIALAFLLEKLETRIIHWKQKDAD
ncbi:MAG: ABC transporter permease [Deltaproteobacteria bacterium]|nr:ABC transporter permease [Deltaproteobacteria bacterium]MCB9489895.1 ABC transporter permease [Deltaproteobacteria bacterium]